MTRRRVLRGALAVVCGLLLVELGFRLLAPRLADVDRGQLAELRAFVCDGRSRLYEPRAHTVFVRNTAREETNSLGFRGPEWPLEKRPGVPRVALLGGSTTESTDPQALARALAERSGRAEGEVEVLNAGLSGWTTAESLVNWFLLLQDHEPDVVVLHHAANDVPPRFRRGHRPDYSHYRRPWQAPPASALTRLLVRWSDVAAWVVLERGEATVQRATAHPVVDSLRALDSPLPFAAGVDTYRRNLRTIGRHARSQGAEVVLMTMAARPDDRSDYETLTRRGLEEHNQVLRALAEEEGWVLFDLARLWPTVDGSAQRFTDLVHLDAEGIRLRTRLLADHLVASCDAL